MKIIKFRIEIVASLGAFVLLEKIGFLFKELHPYAGNYLGIYSFVFSDKNKKGQIEISSAIQKFSKLFKEHETQSGQEIIIIQNLHIKLEGQLFEFEYLNNFGIKFKNNLQLHTNGNYITEICFLEKFEKILSSENYFVVIILHAFAKYYKENKPGNK